MLDARVPQLQFGNLCLTRSRLPCRLKPEFGNQPNRTGLFVVGNKLGAGFLSGASRRIG